MPSIPEELQKQVACGNCVVMLGNGIGAQDQLPVKRIVDWGYACGVETALRETEQRYDLVVCDHELPYADPTGVLLVKPYGVADRPGSLVLTEMGVQFTLALDIVST